MFTAMEAKEKTCNVIENCSTKELKNLEELITDAISNGEFSIVEGGSLQHETIRKLKELGYEVTFGSQFNEQYYSISWKNATKEKEVGILTPEINEEQERD